MDKRFLLAIFAACVLFLGCSNESKDEVKKATNTTIDKVAEATSSVTQKAKEVIQDVKKETTPIVDEVVEKSKEAVETSKEVAVEVTKKAVDMKETVQKKIHDATAPSVDTKALYVRCASCHGQSAEKKALNSSQVVKGWSKEKIFTALKGYKAGTYGGAMKGVMVGQLKDFDNAQLEALASHISSF